MKPGTLVELPDGRVGTIVYHGLDGYGIRWGRLDLDLEPILQGDGNTTKGSAPGWFENFPEAMLRDPYPGTDLECVGEDYRIIKQEASCE